MAEYSKRRAQELLYFAGQCKGAGLRVFLSNWKHSIGRREYFHVSDGIGIAYVSNSDINFGHFSLHLTYKGGTKFGCGCGLIEWDEWKYPRVEDVKRAVSMRRGPHWLVKRYEGQPPFYRDVDEWLEGVRKHCEIVEL